MDEDEVVVKSFECISVKEGDIVLEQGSLGNLVFVVEVGELCEFIKRPNGRYRQGNSFNAGTFFGDFALMYSTPRLASMKAMTSCTLWVVHRETYRNALTQYKIESNKKHELFLRGVKISDKPLSSILSGIQIKELTAHLDCEYIRPNDIIARRGSTIECFYIVARGSVSVYETNSSTKEVKKIRTLQKGICFIVSYLFLNLFSTCVIRGLFW